MGEELGPPSMGFNCSRLFATGSLAFFYFRSLLLLSSGTAVSVSTTISFSLHLHRRIFSGSRRKIGKEFVR